MLVACVGHMARWFRVRSLEFACLVLDPGVRTYWLCNPTKLPNSTEPQFPHLQADDGDASVPYAELG